MTARPRRSRRAEAVIRGLPAALDGAARLTSWAGAPFSAAPGPVSGVADTVNLLLVEGELNRRRDRLGTAITRRCVCEKPLVAGRTGRGISPVASLAGG